MQLPYPARRAAVLLAVCLPFALFAQVDLEVALTTPDAQPSLYSTFNVTLTVTNAGDEPATAVELGFDVPSSLTFVGGGEGTATQGLFEPYASRWVVGELAPGATAELYMNFFNREAVAKTLFAQVTLQGEPDADSAPGNGAPPAATEDDETALVLNDTGGTPCELVAELVASGCDDAGTPAPGDDRWDLTVTLRRSSTGSAALTVGTQTRSLQVGGSFRETGLYIEDGQVPVFATNDGGGACSRTYVAQPPAPCSAPPPPGTCAGNLLGNGGFEEPFFRDWSVLNFFNGIRVVDAPVVEGAQALRFYDGQVGVIYQTVDAAPGETYRLEYAYENAAGVGGTAQLKFLTADWQPLPTIPLAFRATGAAYRTEVIESVAPPGTRYAEVRFERDATSGPVYLDAVCLTGGGFDPCANDNEAPRLQFCPQNFVVEAAAGADSSVVTWQAPFVNDNCSAVEDIAFTSNLQPGVTLPLGTTTVAYRAVDEAGNVNTCSFDVRVTAPSAPTMDLRLTQVYRLFSFDPGRETTLRYVVFNDGAGALPAGVVARAYLSDDPVLSPDDVLVDEADLAGLPAGSSDLTSRVTLGTGFTPGTYYVVVLVDADDVLAEADEGNNVRANVATVGGFCFGQSLFPWHEWITELTVGATTFTSGKSQRTFHSSPSVSVERGTDVAYRFETTFSYATSRPHYSLYVDTSRDVRLTPDELLLTAVGPRPAPGAGATSVADGTWSVPAGLPIGVYRARLVMRRDSFVEDPCRPYDFGEVEDFLLEVTPQALLRRQLETRGGVELAAYPSPASDYVYLAAAKLAAQDVDLVVSDARGRPLRTRSVRHEPTRALELETRSLPPGLYVLSLRTRDGRVFSARVPVVR